MKTILFSLLSLLVICSSCNREFNKVLKSKDAEYKLKKANEYYAKEEYYKAQQLFVELFPVFKGTDKFEELYYKYAYSSYYQENYLDAENLFKGYLGVFPNSPHAEEIAYLHALTFYKRSPPPELDQSQTHTAIGLMQAFINNYPNSERKDEAMAIIEKMRDKLEKKLYKSAQLYFDMENYEASAIYFTNLMNTYPQSNSGDEYMLMAVKSYYELAKNSIASKQEERYQKVITQYFDFSDRFPESKLLAEAKDFKILSEKNIKQINNEQLKTTTDI